MKKKQLSSTKLIPLSFLAAILVGTVLLMLPICSASGTFTDPLTALFTATTSVCVTGLVADNDPDVLKEMAGNCTAAIKADLENEEEILALDLKSLDIVVVAMAGNLSASILAVTIAKEKGVPLVVAKSSGDRMSSILKKVGADKIIIPEESSGLQSARILLSDTLLDYFKVDDNLSMIEMRPEEKWIGKSLIELNLRKKYDMNVVAIKKDDENWQIVDPSKPLPNNCKLLIVIDTDSLAKLNKA